MKKPPLPRRLRYLRPIMRSFEKLSPETLNEDLDASNLTATLRKRIRTLKPNDYQNELDCDRAALEEWLKRTGRQDHPAYWILGMLSSPHLAKGLARKPRPAPKGPTVHFDAPSGWKLKKEKFALHARQGHLFTSIRSLPSATIKHLEETFKALMRPERDRAFASVGLKVSASKCTLCAVKVGRSSGKKFTEIRQPPYYWKRVNYLLKVAGGHVAMTLDGGGKDFDEAEFEGKLGTIRVC